MKHLAIFFFMLIACTSETLTAEQQEYQASCFANNDPFMLMSETKNGQVVGPACYGCMPDLRNHLCSLEEYQRFP